MVFVHTGPQECQEAVGLWTEPLRFIHFPRLGFSIWFRLALKLDFFHLSLQVIELQTNMPGTT